MSPDITPQRRRPGKLIIDALGREVRQLPGPRKDHARSNIDNYSYRRLEGSRAIGEGRRQVESAQMKPDSFVPGIFVQGDLQPGVEIEISKIGNVSPRSELRPEVRSPKKPRQNEKTE